MCTLLTLSREVFEKSQDSIKAVASRIRKDASTNPDGMCLMLVDKTGNYTRLQTKSTEAIISLIEDTPWERFWLHSRFATKGRATLANMHGWIGRGVYVMHNGSIQHPLASKYAVDSQAIIGAIQVIGILETLKNFLTKEYFANVFIIRPGAGDYVVHRSRGGDLYTDGLGNYSTRKDETLGITVDVKEGDFQHKAVKESADGRTSHYSGTGYHGYYRGA